MQTAPTTAVERLLQTGRGVLLIGHERTRAMELAAGCDTAVGEVRDPRGFNTVLLAPDLTCLRDSWEHIVLLDGDLLPGEAEMIARQCPGARLLALKPNPAFAELLDSLALSNDPLRELYKRVKAGGDTRAETLAQAAGLTVPQVLTGLTGLAQVELLRFSAEPYAVVMLPMQKRDPSESALIRYLRSRIES